MLKMVMISYNEAVDTEVMEVLSACAVKNYTKVVGTFGKGSASGTHLGTDVWPGLNNILYVACEELEAKKILTCVRQLRKKIGAEGVKAFLMPLEELT
ncbi:MAG: PG0541 family transporter-associated protein [Candidatus Omnitrophota bacterium]|jgi:hypothetical protein